MGIMMNGVMWIIYWFVPPVVFELLVHEFSYIAARFSFFSLCIIVICNLDICMEG